MKDLENLEKEISEGKTISDSTLSFGLTLKALILKGVLNEEIIENLEKELESLKEFSQPTEIEKKKIVLKKRYKILNLLREGGMGKVYKAHDTKLNRYVAIKFLKGDDQVQIKRFINEAQAQAKVNHKAI